MPLLTVALFVLFVHIDELVDFVSAYRLSVRQGQTFGRNIVVSNYCRGDLRGRASIAE